jgi:hypothetical protein
MKQGLLFSICLFLAGCGDRPLKTPENSGPAINKDSLMIVQKADSMLKALEINSQPKGEIIFTADYKNKRDSFSVHFSIKNITDSMYYFHIAALGWVNNKWTTLIDDINALGKMDFAYPKPLKPGRTYTTRVSLADIHYEFEMEKKFEKVKFTCYYYKKQNFFSPYQVLYSGEFVIPAKTN